MFIIKIELFTFITCLFTGAIISLSSLFDAEVEEIRVGSNHICLGITKANIQIGLQHPIIGVGSGLNTAYLYEKFKDDQNREIKNRFIKSLEKMDY